MTAPNLVFSRGPVNYTATPVVKNGFQINASISQADVGQDWTWSVSLSRIAGGTVDTIDQVATYSASGKVPFNEAQNDDAIKAKLQAQVNMVFDTFVPGQGTP